MPILPQFGPELPPARLFGLFTATKRLTAFGPLDAVLRLLKNSNSFSMASGFELTKFMEQRPTLDPVFHRVVIAGLDRKHTHRKP
jgi:hypothetical protein